MHTPKWRWLLKKKYYLLCFLHCKDIFIETQKQPIICMKQPLIYLKSFFMLRLCGKIGKRLKTWQCTDVNTWHRKWDGWDFFLLFFFVCTYIHCCMHVHEILPQEKYRGICFLFFFSKIDNPCFNNIKMTFKFCCIDFLEKKVIFNNSFLKASLSVLLGICMCILGSSCHKDASQKVLIKFLHWV